MIIDETWYQRPDHIPDRLVAGGIVIRKEKDTFYVALVSEGNNQEYYLLPKGGVEDGESLETAARREILEEAGLTDLYLITKLGISERLEFNKKTWCTAHYFLFVTKQLSGKPTDTEKSYRLHWFPLEELPTFFWPDQKKIIEENRDKIKGVILSESEESHT